MEPLGPEKIGSKCPKGEVREGEITGELRRLANIADENKDLAVAVESRFHPILRNPTPEQERTAIESPAAPTANVIRSAADVIEDASEILRRVLDRCEL
jgi:hypothetical protein